MRMVGFSGNRYCFRKFYLAVFLIGFVSLTSLLSGCATLDWFLGKKTERGPSELMDKAMEDLGRGYYKAATESFQKIKDRYPYSKFATIAELKIADTLFLLASYDESYEAYKEFERLHPTNPSIPYVIYREGLCHFNQIKTIDRDQTHSVKAKEEFDRLVKRFPKDVYASRARMKIRKCYIDLAGHELSVAHFYYKKKEYRAAAGRFRYAIENYPDVGQYAEALEYLGKCEERLARKHTS
ncbi:MAG: outer membrane protein assembly factor BamD [Desulfatiglandaceae bacterium]